MPNYYPIMLDVRGRPAIVVGGDETAAEKATALAASGARVTVVNPEFCAGLLEMAARGEVTLSPKPYEYGDLAGAFIVVSATTYNHALSEAVWAEGQERGQIVNVVDVPARCNFIVPSILRRGQMTIAVSSEGAAPGLSKRIRQRLEELFPPAYGAYLRLATAARAHLREHGVSYGRRDDFFGDYWASDVLDQLAADDAAGAVATTQTLLRRYGVDIPAAAVEGTS